MTASKRHLLYLCADRGIPFGGIKGSSIHIREFLEALRFTDYSPSALVTRRFASEHYSPSFPVYSLENDNVPILFHEIAIQQNFDRELLREISDFNRNQLVFEKLHEIFDRSRFDLIYERYSLFSLAGRIFSKQVKVPFVMEVNAPLVKEASQYRNLSLLEPARKVEKYLFTTADHIVAVSEPMKSYIHAIAPDAQVTVVPNGVDLERFDGNLQTNDWRARVTKNPDTDFVIGFVGSVKPWHGVELLVETLADLVNTDKNFSLCIVGNANQLKDDLKLRAKALGLKGRLTLTGAVPYEDIPAIMQSMDVLVAPYPDLADFYFSPLKVFEYMATGKPIVASRIGQLTELLTDGGSALLTKPGDQQELTQAILRLRSDAELRQKLGMRAQQIAREEHSWGKRIAMAAGIFDHLLKSETELSRNALCG